MAKLSFDPYLGWVNISDPNNIPADARVIGANDLLRYEKFGRDAVAKINEIESTASDAGLAGLAQDPKSEFGAWLNNTIATATAVEGITADPGSQLITYGHSFLAEQGLSDPSKYWARIFAASLGFTYPTAAGGATEGLKRAAGGSRIEDVVARMYGNPELHVKPNTKALFVLQTMINSARWQGNDPIALRSATNSARGIMAAINASERIEELDERVTYSGNFIAQGGMSWPSGGGYKYHTTVGQYFEFTAPTGRDCYVSIVGKRGANQTLADVTDQTSNGAKLASLDMSEQANDPSAGSQPQVPFLYKVPASARGHVVRFTLTGGTALALDVIFPQSTTPPPVLWMKDPRLANYAASTAFPNGSDAAVNAFNAIIDTMAREFPNIIVADPNRPGYWDKTKHTLSDQVHANEAGNAALARAASDAIRAWQTRKILGLV